jgi:hypothetical protein
MKGKTSLLIILLIPWIIMIWLSPACRDPNDYQPPDDTLEDPPEAPFLFHPMDDTFFYLYGNNTYPFYVTLEWSYVEETEFYLLQFIDDDSLFTDIEPIRIYTNTCQIEIDSNDYYYWRVCAYSSNWKYYTAWSQTWGFRTRYFPNSQ